MDVIIHKTEKVRLDNRTQLNVTLKTIEKIFDVKTSDHIDDGILTREEVFHGHTTFTVPKNIRVATNRDKKALYILTEVRRILGELNK